MIVFGAVGVAKTAGDDFFGHPDVSVLGLRTNPAFSLLLGSSFVSGGSGLGQTG